MQEKNVYIYFALFNGYSIFSKLIKFFTRSNYSHVAYCYDEDDFTKIIEVWSRSYNIKDIIQTRWLFNSIHNHSPKTKIEIYRLSVTYEQAVKVKEFFYNLAMNKVGYNWLGVIAFVLPFWKKETKKGYFCSEGCTEALKYAGIIPQSIQSWKYSPDEFLELISALGAEYVTTIHSL